MCGIVGYVGPRPISSVLLDGLRRLEYRGYDSCGIAVLDGSLPTVIRTVGRVARLEEKLLHVNIKQNGTACGIAHTRWATHGRPSEENAHPHRDCTGNFIAVHNGIIENYVELKRKLMLAGHRFQTATDTEVLPHLIESYFNGNLKDAVRQPLLEIEGVFGIVAVSTFDPDTLVTARKGPPIVVGMGDGENFVASDVPALLPYTRDVMFLNNGEMAIVRQGSVELCGLEGGQQLHSSVQRVTWSQEMAEKQGYPHFMLKEIFEQPTAVRNTLRGRLSVNRMVTLEKELGPGDTLRSIDRVVIVGCGTSLHAGLIGKFLIELLSICRSKSITVRNFVTVLR